MKAGTLRFSVYGLLLIATTLVVVACASKKPPPKEPAHTETIADAAADVVEEPEPPKPKPLFERLGKVEGITKFIDTFIKNASADSKLSKRLATLKGPKLDKLKKDLADQICVESGGPENGADCKYEGRFMKELLGAKTKLKEDEWLAMLTALRAALEEHKIDNDTQQDLAAGLGKFKEDAVEAPKKPAGKK